MVERDLELELEKIDQIDDLKIKYLPFNRTHTSEYLLGSVVAFPSLSKRYGMTKDLITNVDSPQEHVLDRKCYQQWVK